jgi:signal transduction histidine kinase
MPNSSRDLSLKHSADKLQGFIASLPGMACQIILLENGSIAFPYVSGASSTLLNVGSDDLQKDASYFLNLIHPDDFSSFLDTLKQSANTLNTLHWEGRVVLSDAVIKWVSLSAAPQHNQGKLTHLEGMLLDITEDKQKSIEINNALQQLQALSSHNQDAREQERLRISHEIHNEIGSLLAAIKIDLSWLNQRLPLENPALLEKEKAIEDLVNKSITAANHLANSLRPGFLDCFGIIAAIEIEAQEFSKRSHIPFTMITSQDEITLPESHTIILFRICQEILNNIYKHARAKLVQIEIVKGIDHLEMIISDDGTGFSDAERNKPLSFGLRSIYERAAHLGGTVKIASNLGDGTQIAIFVPLKEETPQQALFDGTTS